MALTLTGVNNDSDMHKHAGACSKCIWMCHSYFPLINMIDGHAGFYIMLDLAFLGLVLTLIGGFHEKGILPLVSLVLAVVPFVFLLLLELRII
jgi:hypothetical protein